MTLLKTAKWNHPRNGLNAKSQLDINMFDEEFAEFQEAYLTYLETSANKAAYLDKDLYEDAMLTICADLLDAWGDATFVADGWLSKELATGTVNGINIANTHTGVALDLMLKMANEVLMSEFVYEMFDYNKVKEFIYDANNQKPVGKVVGKVKKGKNWTDPKELIGSYLRSIIIDTDTDTLKYPTED